MQKDPHAVKKKGIEPGEWVALSRIWFRIIFAKRIFCFAFVSGSTSPARITLKSALKKVVRPF
jgi:hypothetical protein